MTHFSTAEFEANAQQITTGDSPSLLLKQEMFH
jgi:hypothetical protein